MMYEIVLKSGKPDSVLRCCADCCYLKAAASWWCTNISATNARRTSIPGVSGCHYWKPCRIKSQLKWWERWFNLNGVLFVDPVVRNNTND